MNIVFVHLNSKLPKYLRLNIEHCITLFPNNPVYLIHNQPNDNFRINGLNLYEYLPEQKWKQLESNLKHPKDFRANFWLTSLARFLAIADFMKNHDKSALHIESDNIISQDFPIDKFDSISADYAYPIVSKERGIASLVYFKSAESSLRLAEYALVKVVEDNLTSDMLILRSFFNDYKSNVQVLPTGLSMQLTHPNVNDPEVLNSMREGMKLLGGVFDGSDLGVYFLGTDPRNRRGISYLGSPVEANYAEIKFWQLKLNKHRSFVDLQIQDDETARVFSLHATCKKKNLFMREKQYCTLNYHLKAMQKGRTKLIYPEIFFVAVYKSFLRKSVRLILRLKNNSIKNNLTPIDWKKWKSANNDSKFENRQK